MIAQLLSPAGAYLLVEWAIRIGALIFIPFRRSPDAARAWLLLLLFLPVPGLVLYLLIGRPTYPRARRWRMSEAVRQMEDGAAELRHSHACRKPVLSDRFRQSARLIEQVSRFPAMGGNDIALLTNYAKTIGALVADIDAARHHIHLQTYIFADDATGEQVMDALAGAANRGVECRVLYDPIGSARWTRRVRKKLSARGVRVAQSLPVAPWRRASARADLRNHRKIAVIDGILGYVGSQNIVDAQFRPGVVYEELVARVRGPAVVEMQTVFALDWFVETGERLSGEGYFRHYTGEGKSTAQLMPSGPDYGEVGIGHLTVALVHGARERVIVTTPYFIPEAALLQAMRTAVLRGVAVHLIVSSASDNSLVRFAQRSYYSELLEAGVKVHLYKAGFLHAKHISIDGEVALIGSSNVDVRSYVLNAEATLIVYDDMTVADLHAAERRYIAASEQMTQAGWEARSPAAKLTENIARLVGPLL